MKRLLCAAGLLFISAANAQNPTVVSGHVRDLSLKDPITIGNSYAIHSEILGEDRIIKIALPKGYQTSTKKYPVMYMPDAQWNFLHDSQTLQVLYGSGMIPEMILVAVDTGENRERDLLPTMDKQSKAGGGSDSFHRFLKEELIPSIENQYRTSPYRILSGASFGGVFVMNALLKDISLFNAYLVISPSIWWDNRVMLQRTKDFLAKNQRMDTALFLCVANEGPGMGVDALAQLLKSTAPSGLVWKFEKYPNEIHETSGYRGNYDGLRFIFSDWKKDSVVFESRGDLVSSGDSVLVEMKGKGKAIRYTLDGTEPSLQSVVYENPLSISKPVIIKAMPIYANNVPGNSSTLAINVLKRLPAEKGQPALNGGLRYSYFEGTWDLIPDFTKLTPVKSGVTANLAMGERKRDESFAFNFTGFLDIPEEGVYQFFLTSDDGSRLLIGDQLVVDNDGLHGPEEKNGKVFLGKGKHRITIQFLQQGGGFELKFAYASNKLSKREVPLSAFTCPEK
jgi:predicted alpha/beta superfamily hydrolase